MYDSDKDKKNNEPEKDAIKPMAQNPNPAANENIRNQSDEEQPDTEATNKVGSEITDGEGG